MPKTKWAMRTSITHWPELEKYLEEWVLSQQQTDYTVPRNNIGEEAIKWAKAHLEVSKGFKGTTNWCIYLI